LLVGYVGILTHIAKMRQVKAVKLLRKQLYCSVMIKNNSTALNPCLIIMVVKLTT
jgi:hypothetical protein